MSNVFYPLALLVIVAYASFVLLLAGEDLPLPTLREYLNHPNGFHMAFAPAFFGFFAFFGALIGLEEETNGRIVPSISTKNSCDVKLTTCKLKSVAGASAGTMATVMLACGIQPRQAAEFACTFTWRMVADPPGLGGCVKAFMRNFINYAAKVKSESSTSNSSAPLQLEDALVPVAVSAFDLLRMKGILLLRGCMAKAARSSAGFPGLFQPNLWRHQHSERNWLPDMLLIDGGIKDCLGLNGLSIFSSPAPQKMRVINLIVGDFSFIGPNGMDGLPKDINADSLVSMTIVNTPMCGPWAMKNGPRAVELARKAMAAVLDCCMERGASDNHFIVRVDTSKWND
ncbi:hypothetical protein HJC23_008215 [Cyclotella cryptica]|uniref:PNPLA domain-containing protein n=1 Tax=Cyclotella cryptica TaxID=29204 RepID=A0ABD3NJH1_9STRA